MLVTYPALFYYDKEAAEGEAPYFVTFPDIEHSATQGENVFDALYMASDYLGMMMSGYIENNIALPIPSHINDFNLEEDNPFNDGEDKLLYDKEKSFISFVSVDLSVYII